MRSEAVPERNRQQEERQSEIWAISGRTVDPLSFQNYKYRADERNQQDVGGELIVQRKTCQAAQWGCRKTSRDRSEKMMA